MNTSKQSAGWATDLRDKFRSDIFFSSRIKIIAFVVLIEYSQQLIYTGVTEALNEALTTGNVDPLAIQTAHAAGEDAFIFVLTAVIALATVAGAIAARVALEPVAHALDLQRKFIATAAHELRTPLAILKTNNEVALFDLPNSSPVRELLEENVSDVNHLTGILNNLMLLHRTNAFGSITFEKVEVKKIIERVRARLMPLAETRNINLEVQEAKLPDVHGNATALEQIFFNLVKNAILYTPGGGSVTVAGGHSSADVASIQVTDTGIGIAKGDFPHIFEPFYRSEDIANTEKGSGLGLAVVFELVKLHSGKIMIQSAKNKGTTFVISLPRFKKQAESETAEEGSAVHFDFSNKSV
jgi:signal transduction histidine kinase